MAVIRAILVPIWLAFAISLTTVTVSYEESYFLRKGESEFITYDQTIMTTGGRDFRTFRTTNDRRIRIDFTQLVLNGDFLLAFGEGLEQGEATQLLKFDGAAHPSVVRSVGIDAWLMLETSGSTSNPSTGHMEVSTEAIEVTHVKQGNPLTVMSPKFPRNYDNNVCIVWYIRAPDDYTLSATLMQLDLEQDKDYIFIGDGTVQFDRNNDSWKGFTGVIQNVWSDRDFNSNGPSLVLVFISDGGTTKFGFVVECTAEATANLRVPYTASEKMLFFESALCAFYIVWVCSVIICVHCKLHRAKKRRKREGASEEEGSSPDEEKADEDGDPASGRRQDGGYATISDTLGLTDTGVLIEDIDSFATAEGIIGQDSGAGLHFTDEDGYLVTREHEKGSSQGLPTSKARTSVHQAGKSSGSQPSISKVVRGASIPYSKKDEFPKRSFAAICDQPASRNSKGEIREGFGGEAIPAEEPSKSGIAKSERKSYVTFCDPVSAGGGGPQSQKVSEGSTADTVVLQHTYHSMEARPKTKPVPQGFGGDDDPGEGFNKFNIAREERQSYVKVCDPLPGGGDFLRSQQGKSSSAADTDSVALQHTYHSIANRPVTKSSPTVTGGAMDESGYLVVDDSRM